MPFSVRDFASEDPFNYRRGVPLRNPAPAASGAVRALTEAPGSLATLGASRRASAEERVGPGRAARAVVSQHGRQRVLSAAVQGK